VEFNPFCFFLQDYGEMMIGLDDRLILRNGYNGKGCSGRLGLVKHGI